MRWYCFCEKTFAYRLSAVRHYADGEYHGPFYCFRGTHAKHVVLWPPGEARGAAPAA